jgi:hypothetical protein
MTAAVSTDFRRLLKQSQDGLYIKPIVAELFQSGQFPAHTVEFRPHPLDLARGDGWFHPSSHPLASESFLYHYLTHPERFAPERIPYNQRLAMLVGTAFGDFIEACLRDTGLLPPELQKCKVCPPERDCHQPGVKDEVCGERGHMDGILALPGHDPGDTILELKTTGSEYIVRKLLKVEDLDLESFKELFPDYYAQVQSYLRMSRRKQARLFLMQIGGGYEMREWHIPLDRVFCHQVQEKYIAVRQAYADQRPPRCGCLAKTRTKCAARALCGA